MMRAFVSAAQSSNRFSAIALRMAAVRAALVRLAAAVLALAAALAWASNLLLSNALSSLAVILLLDPAGRGLEAGGVRVVAVIAAAAAVLACLAVVVAVGRRTDLLPRIDAVDDSDAVEAAR